MKTPKRKAIKRLYVIRNWAGLRVNGFTSLTAAKREAKHFPVHAIDTYLLHSTSEART